MTNPLQTPTINNSLILICDDDVQIRYLTRMHLLREGFAVIEAGNGHEAIQVFEAGQVDLILIDYQMPIMNGMDTVRAIRATVEGARVPVIMMTAMEDNESIDNAFNAGVSDFVTKPVRWTVLRHRIRRLLEYRYAQDQVQSQASQLETLVQQRTRQLQTANTRLQQEMAQREASEMKLRQITDTMLDAVYQVNNDGTIAWASPSCWQVLGYAPPSLLGEDIFRFVHPDDMTAMHHDVATVGAAEYRFQHANGNYIWLETLTNIILSANGDVQGIVFASRNITDRMHAENELRELNRLKTEFLSTAAHELRTPLTSIRGFSEVMLSRQFTPERQTQYLRIINDQATQLGKLIDDLLDISRLEDRRALALMPTQFDIAALIRALMQPFAENTTQHVFDFLSFARDEPVWVTGDALRLSQVVQNLLSNAVKYSPAGGVIRVHIAQTENGMLQISVTDSGIGMTPEQIAHLFEKFYRADDSNTTISGTGLGLAIAKMLVELHEGLIWVESIYGLGSTFTFTLPISLSGTKRDTQEMAVVFAAR